MLHKHYLRQNPSPTSKSRIAAQFSSRNQFFRIDAGRSLYRFIKRRFKCAARRPLHSRIQSGFNNVAGRGLHCCIESLFQCTSGRFVPNIVQAANASKWSVFQSQNCDFASSATTLPSCVPLVVSQFAKLLATARSTSCGSCRSRATATYVFTGGSYSAGMHSFHKRLHACCCRCGRTTKAASGRLPAAVGTWG